MNLDAGRLVALNVVVKDNALLDDVEYVIRFFHDLIERIGMRYLRPPEAVIVPPDVGNVADAHADDGGLTVQCIISTSHIAFHSWTLQNRFRLVVDSCKDYSTVDVTSFVYDRFPVKEMSIQDVPYAQPMRAGTRGRRRTDHGSAQAQA